MSIVGVKARISELRNVMEAEAIDTRAGGYCLTEVGMAECRQAFLAMADDMLASARAAA